MAGTRLTSPANDAGPNVTPTGTSSPYTLAAWVAVRATSPNTARIYWVIEETSTQLYLVSEGTAIELQTSSDWSSVTATAPTDWFTDWRYIAIRMTGGRGKRRSRDRHGRRGSAGRQHWRC